MSDFATPHWGARHFPDGRGRFCLWAPDQDGMQLRLPGGDRPMQAIGDGWFALETDDVPAGTDYSYVCGTGQVVPDPAARQQAGDIHGPSKLIDPDTYKWTCDWPGRPWAEAVLYELHVGTFTPEGTFAAAAAKMAHIAAAGFTAVELMPVAQFAGTRGWGYDGVLLFAPHNVYGTPDELRALVDAAHAAGLMILLDVVYNHFGPEGNYLHEYADHFYDADRDTPWGSAIAYRLPQVRRFFVDNAIYWLDEFRFDGLRLDAIDHVRDPAADPSILVQLAREVRQRFPDRHLTTEDDRNVIHLHPRDPDGSVPLYTAEWNDDFHNAAHVVATGETEGYYGNYKDHPTALMTRALAEGFAYQGEDSPTTGKPRGVSSVDQPPLAFVDFLQNHDQIGNRAFGDRLTTLTDGRMLRAMTATLLLSPHIPLMFMGDEYDESRPFLFFTDFRGELAQAVRDGRRREFKDFVAFGRHADPLSIPDPNAPETFAAAKLDWRHCTSDDGQAALKRVRRLLELRQRRIVPHLDGTGPRSGRILAGRDGAVAVDWQLKGALLQLRANFAFHGQTLPDATGELLFATDDDPGPDKPPHSVAVYLDAGRN